MSNSNVESYSDVDFVKRLGERVHASKLARLAVNINQYTVMEGGKTARVIASFSKPVSRFTRVEAEEALARVLGDKVTLVANSFKTLKGGSDDFPVMTGFVALSNVTEELTPERNKTMTVIAKNVLMDAEDGQLWAMSEVDGKPYISRNGQDNLSELLACVKQHKTNLQTYQQTHANVSSGEFVGFVDSDEGLMKFGMVVAKNESNPVVLCMADDAMYEISSECVIHAITPNLNHPVMSGVKKIVETASTNSAGMVPEILEYYKKVYAQSGEYFAQLEELIRKYGSL